jgi:hypothetical protein
VRRALILVLLAPVAMSAGACGRAGKQGVRAGIEQLASISAESALMAEDLARGRTTTTFVRVHGAELSAQALHEAEKLNDDPVAPSLMAPIEIAITLSSDIGAANRPEVKLRLIQHRRKRCVGSGASVRRLA